MQIDFDFSDVSRHKIGFRVIGFTKVKQNKIIPQLPNAFIFDKCHTNGNPLFTAVQLLKSNKKK